MVVKFNSISTNKNSEPGSLFLFVQAALGVSVLLLSGCQPEPVKQEARYSGATMGTYYQVTIVAQPEDDLSTLNLQIEHELQAVDQSMSTYKQDSELSRLKSAASE